MKLALHGLPGPRKSNGAEELGLFEAARLAGEFTHADSARWLKTLRPGVDVVWTDADTKLVEFSLTVPSAADTFSAAILSRFAVVRGTTVLRVDRRSRSRYRWDLRDDDGRVVEPGVYCVQFYGANAGTEFYVVVAGGGMRD